MRFQRALPSDSPGIPASPTAREPLRFDHQSEDEVLGATWKDLLVEDLEREIDTRGDHAQGPRDVIEQDHDLDRTPSLGMGSVLVVGPEVRTDRVCPGR